MLELYSQIFLQLAFANFIIAFSVRQVGWYLNTIRPFTLKLLIRLRLLGYWPVALSGL